MNTSLKVFALSLSSLCIVPTASKADYATGVGIHGARIEQAKNAFARSLENACYCTLVKKDRFCVEGYLDRAAEANTNLNALTEIEISRSRPSLDPDSPFYFETVAEKIRDTADSMDVLFGRPSIKDESFKKDYVLERHVKSYLSAMGAASCATLLQEDTSKTRDYIRKALVEISLFQDWAEKGYGATESQREEKMEQVQNLWFLNPLVDEYYETAIRQIQGHLKNIHSES